MNSTGGSLVGAALDPTAHEALQNLRSEILKEIEVHDKYKVLRYGKPALVLSGGGGKGAYEAGVILALFDCGIKEFSAIGGTSVGALNAALCQQLVRKNDRDLVLRIWSNLSFSKVLEPTPSALIKLGAYLVMSGAAHLNIIDIIGRLSHADAEIDDVRDLITRILTGVISVAIIGATGIVFTNAVFLLLGPLIGGFRFVSPNGASLICLLLVVLILPKLAGWLTRRSSIVSNAPLRRTIETIDIEDVRTGAPEVICTLATEPTLKGRQSKALYPTLSKSVSKELATDILLQSAALPEIFPLRSVCDGQFVDGGVADNTPILGLAGAPTNQLIVVYLDHRIDRLLERYRKWHFGFVLMEGRPLWDRIIALKLREGGRLRKIASRRGEDWEAFRPWFNRIILFPVIPSENLGGIVRGTLNFTSKKANHLIALGYEDTLRQLRRWCLEKPVPFLNTGQ